MFSSDLSIPWTNLSLSGKIHPCNLEFIPSRRTGTDINERLFFGGSTLANIKSQIKRNRQNEKRRVQNRIYRGRARTFVVKAREATETGTSVEDAKVAVFQAISQLDSAVQKGIIHKNNAARRKSRLTKRLAALEA
jgi:small subunit ribosomal protein S20